MKAIRVIALVLILGLATAFSCEDKNVAAQKDCGCDGAVKSTIVDEQGAIELLEVDGRRNFRVVNKNKSLFFIVCDTTSVASLYRAGKLAVKFSCNVKEFCDEPTVHPLPPIYQPIDVTKIEVLN